MNSENSKTMKKEILKRLYESGDITLDELITLSINGDEIKAECDEMKAVEAEPIKISIDKLIDDATDEVSNSENGLDVNNILRYMDEHDWRWRGKHVTREMFNSTTRMLVSDVINQAKIYIYNCGLSYDDICQLDKSWSSATGGITATAYIDEEILSVEVSFTIDNGFTSVNIKDIMKAE